MVAPSSANDPYWSNFTPQSLYTASQNKFSRGVSPFGKTCTYRENITRYTAATLVWECVPGFNIVRTYAQCHVYLATEALSHTEMNGPAAGDRPWLWGTNCGDARLSAVDDPPGPSVAAVHGPGPFRISFSCTGYTDFGLATV